MKYECSITIDRPRDRVVEIFQDPDHITGWQPTFKGMEVISGDPGTTGSKTMMKYEMRGKITEMLETITLNDLPDRFETIYEAKGVKNYHNNQFVEDGQSTKWMVDTEFKFSGFMAVMSLFLRKVFYKETYSSMELLKNYIESL